MYGVDYDIHLDKTLSRRKHKMITVSTFGTGAWCHIFALSASKCFDFFFYCIYYFLKIICIEKVNANSMNKIYDKNECLCSVDQY